MLYGDSHGCHRLFNHLAIRLGSFLVRQRGAVRRGSLAVQYFRSVHLRGIDETVHLETRGYVYELARPVTIRVCATGRQRACLDDAGNAGPVRALH